MNTCPTHTTNGTFPPAQAVDVRLVVSDLDGTLLDGDGRIPDALWPMLDELKDRGIVFAAASGRQYATLQRQFEPVKNEMAFLAENGTLVAYHGEVVKMHPVDRDFVQRLITHTRALNQEGKDLNGIRCGRKAAYIEGNDPAFVAQVQMFYQDLHVVDDLLDVDDETLKFAVFDKRDAETQTAPQLREFCTPNQVVVSTRHWLDIMAPGANKGAAVKDLQNALGVTPAQTVVFGDFLNDLEMMFEAEHSFAMANAHPALIDAARYVAPSHKEHGVITTLRTLLDQSATAGN